ncbi:hypothetical protein R6Q57_004698 [Mikania cordata]
MRNPGLPSTFLGGPSPPVFKTNLCNKYNNAEGCWFGDKCHFAHRQWKLGKPTVQSHHEDPCVMGIANTIRFGGVLEALTTANISILGSLAGPIIVKNGVYSKQICHLTRVRLSIKDNDSNTNLKTLSYKALLTRCPDQTIIIKYADHKQGRIQEVKVKVLDLSLTTKNDVVVKAEEIQLRGLTFNPYFEQLSLKATDLVTCCHALRVPLG